MSEAEGLQNTTAEGQQQTAAEKCKLEMCEGKKYIADAKKYAAEIEAIRFEAVAELDKIKKIKMHIYKQQLGSWRKPFGVFQNENLHSEELPSRELIEGIFQEDDRVKQTQNTISNEGLSDSHLIQIWTTIASTSEQAIDRRQVINTFFLTINTGAIGLLISIYVQYKFRSLINYIPCEVVALVFCGLWFSILRQYWLISSSKVELMKAIESNMKMKIFRSQYQLVTTNGYIGLTVKEAQICMCFIALHVTVLITVLGLISLRWIAFMIHAELLKI